MSDITKIRQELTLNPALYASMSNDQVADNLNQKTIVKNIRTPIADLQRYLFDEDVYVTIIKTAANGSGAVQLVCETLTELFKSQMIDIDINHVRVQSGLDVLKTATIITQAQIDAINTMGVISISRAEQLGIGLVRVGDVMNARAI